MVTQWGSDERRGGARRGDGGTTDGAVGTDTMQASDEWRCGVRRGNRGRCGYETVSQMWGWLGVRTLEQRTSLAGDARLEIGAIRG